MIHVEAPARSGSVPRDGRVVAFAEWGPRDGRAVVFCTGAAMTSALGFADARTLHALGVRLVAVDRAGLGRSTPDPRKSLESTADDVRAVLDHLGASPAGVVGFSQGAPFAVALAASLSMAPSSAPLALVAPTDELAHPRFADLLTPDVARLVGAVAADPAAFEESFAAQVDAEGLWRLVVAMSAPRDQSVYTEPLFATAYRAALADAFAQGPAGYVRDFTLASRRWSVQPEAVDVPVTLWLGALDTSPVHSPDAGAFLATRFPRARRHVLDGEGSSLLWTRAPEILRDLLDVTRAA